MARARTSTVLRGLLAGAVVGFISIQEPIAGWGLIGRLAAIALLLAALALFAPPFIWGGGSDEDRAVFMLAGCFMALVIDVASLTFDT